MRQSPDPLGELIDNPVSELIELLHVLPKPEDEIPFVVCKRPPPSLPHCRQSLAHVSPRSGDTNWCAGVEIGWDEKH